VDRRRVTRAIVNQNACGPGDLHLDPREGEPIACARNTAPLWLALASCLGVTLWLGIFPNQAFDYALKGAQQLLR